MINITELERIHSDFYVPEFKIYINGRNLLTSERVEIRDVQVDSTLDGMDQFSFTVNSSFDFEHRRFVSAGNQREIQGLYAVGSEVEIWMGYANGQSLALMHRGKITSIRTSFPSSGLPEISVSGYDLSYCMKHGKKSRTWDSRKDSQIAVQIAGEYRLSAVVQDSLVEHPRTEQNQQTDQEFLAMLAERNGFEIFTRDRTLYFQEPDSSQAAAVSLEWAKGLVSFSPEINIAEQVTAVEVRGWDVTSKREIVGRAGSGDELGRDGGERSGGEIVEAACRERTTLKVRHPVRSQQEADQKARSLLRERSELFVKGSGEAVGLPEIMPNTNIELAGLGSLFSKTYFVEQATHTISTSGYKTTFRVKETTMDATGRGS